MRSIYALTGFDETLMDVEFTPPRTLDMYSLEAKTLNPDLFRVLVSRDSTV